jgi:hypothetical protein
MPRRPNDLIQVNLRLRESLRRKLEREAKKHRTSFNNEIRVRLEDSLEKAAARDLDSIRADMEIVWLRYAKLSTLLGLEEDLATALAQTKDPEVANLAKAWLKTRRTASKEGEQ